MASKLDPSTRMAVSDTHHPEPLRVEGQQPQPPIVVGEAITPPSPTATAMECDPQPDAPVVDAVPSTQTNNQAAPDLTRSSNQPPAVYEGLSATTRSGIIAAAITIAGLSMTAGWWQSWNLSALIGWSDRDTTAVTEIYGKVPVGEIAKSTILAHLINVQAHLKYVSTHQSLSYLAIGIASAMLAIGFALFLLGADGAFKVQAEKGQDAKLTFAATTPGLFCFITAAILVGLAVGNHVKFNIGDVPIPLPRSSTSPSSQVPGHPEPVFQVPAEDPTKPPPQSDPAWTEYLKQMNRKDK